VAGLLLIGAAAEAEGLFARLARPLSNGGPVVVLAGLLGLDALVSAVMNLDTAAAFMTPLMLYAARGLGANEAPFLYGAVLMANAASLYLPGSNLTNLLVEGGQVSGAEFFGRMLSPALIATAVTGVGLLAWAARMRGHHAGPVASPPPHEWRPGVGVAAVAVAAVLVVALRAPALPVLALGVVVGALRLDRRAFLQAVGPFLLLALLAVAVALGTLAREIDLVLDTSRQATAAIAAGASVVVNNLPAATLLSAHPPLHPRALLIGLDLGPNLAVTGSLSALIWWRSARRLGARPSALTYSLVGAPLAIVAITLATLSLPG
jgi:arsenical pump membrane protein